MNNFIKQYQGVVVLILSLIVGVFVWLINEGYNQLSKSIDQNTLITRENNAKIDKVLLKLENAEDDIERQEKVNHDQWGVITRNGERIARLEE